MREPEDYASPLVSGMVLLFLACVTACLPLAWMIVWLILGPIMVAAFVLSIVVMIRGGAFWGIGLMLVTLLAVPAFVILAPMVRRVWVAESNAAEKRHAEDASIMAQYATPTPYALRREATPEPTPEAPRAVYASIGEAQKEAMRLYPQLAVAGSPMNLRFVERSRRYRATRPAFFQENDWPVMLAKEIGDEMRREGH